jgi:NADPH:quinone reductase-like Zn-dependent oxidoreductase
METKMKAVVLQDFGGPEQLTWKEMPQPVPGPGQVLIRVAATSLNPVELKRASGTMRQIFPVEFPFIPGGDFSGVVEEIGEGATEFHIGDQVFGYSFRGGAYAEFLVVDANVIAPKPATLSHEETASLALVAQTASQALEEAVLQPGQTVLIHGAGGSVGNVAVQLAKKIGARVIAVCHSESIDRLRSYEADQVIDSATIPFESVAKDVDVVLDTLGGEFQQRSFSVLKPGGTLIATSQPPSQEDAERRHVRATMLLTKISASSLAALGKQIDEGTIEPFIGRTYPLSDAAQAWKDSRARHIEGKVVFHVPSAG